MEIRTLEAGERDAWLDLLDGWSLPDGWSGRAFFERFIEDDPTFADDNVWGTRLELEWRKKEFTKSSLARRTKRS